MNEQLFQGSGVFEITDHTTASDWERFISNFEDVLAEWRLTKQSETSSFTYRQLAPGRISAGIWHEKHDSIKFGNTTYNIRYQYLNDTNLDSSNFSITKDKIEHLSSSPKSDLSIRDQSHDEDDDDEFDDADGYSDDQSKNISLKEEEKQHGEHELSETLPECLRDSIDINNDFASKAHCLVRWYNLRRFIILSPKGDTIISENRVKLLLSSASIALSNIDCHVPIFVQIHNPKSSFFQGISEHLNVRTMYEMVFYRHRLKQYEYLSELISLFREKTGCILNDPIFVSIRLNYCLTSFELCFAPENNFTGEEFEDTDDDRAQNASKVASKISRGKVLSQDMRSGASFDQVKIALDDCLPHPYRILRFIHVAALWPSMSNNVVVDTSVHSDLDPAEAPIWTIRCLTSDNCNMKIVHETQAVYELLKSAIDYAYSTLDANQVFTDCTRESLEADCLKLSYELSLSPEVILSRKPGQSIRKLISLLFYRAKELTTDMEALKEIASQLKKKPSLNEIYREMRQQKPSVKEFIIRSQISRPFNPISTPALPQRLFCTICDEEFRLCGAYSELCN